MATMGEEGSTTTGEGGGRGQQETSGIGSPVTNEAYNVISALQSKLEGLEAYRKYAKDGDASLWREITQHDVEGVQRLVDELERLVRDGKLRLGEPGRAKA